MTSATEQTQPSSSPAGSGPSLAAGHQHRASSPRRHGRHVAKHTAHHHHVGILYPALIAVLSVALGLMGFGSAMAMTRKVVEVNIDGSSQEISTWQTTVGEVLSQARIYVDEHDYLSPNAQVEAESGMEITIRTGRQIKLVSEGKEITRWTNADTIAAALEQLGLAGGSVEFSEEEENSRNADPLPLVKAGSKVQVWADGAGQEVTAPQRADVESLLEAANITLGSTDRVHTVFSGGALQLRVVRVKTEVLTQNVEIPFETQEEKDDSKYEGDKSVKQEGQVGTKVVTSEVTTEDGQVVESKVLKEEITLQPVAKIVVVGTKERPAEIANVESAVVNGQVTGVWAKLAQCECGGNPQCNTGNGYYGMYQFTLSTWRSVGGTGLPSEASAEEQTMRAQILQARAGWGQWPACARKLGLM